MERLTYIDHLGWYANGNDGERMRGSHINRLAAYEDTGLKPEKIEQLKGEVFRLRVDKQELSEYRKIGGIDHLKELAQAEKAGRLVVLPCRRGDRLFVLTSDSPDGIEETKCKRITIVNRWDRSTAKVIVKCVYDDWGKAVREFWPEDFGKTVFMTREEAEAALKGGEG